MRSQLNRSIRSKWFKYAKFEEIEEGNVILDIDRPELQVLPIKVAGVAGNNKYEIVGKIKKFDSKARAGDDVGSGLF